MGKTLKFNPISYKKEKEKYNKIDIYGGGNVTLADKQNLKRYKRYLRKKKLKQNEDY